MVSVHTSHTVDPGVGPAPAWCITYTSVYIASGRDMRLASIVSRFECR